MKNKLFAVSVLAFLCIFGFQHSNLLAGPFINGAFIKGANLPWLDGAYDHDIGTNQIDDYSCVYDSTHMNTYLADMHTMGITVVRLWLNENKQGLVLNASGDVTGLQPSFLANLDNIVQLAGQNGISMYLTFNEGDSDWVLNTTQQASYIQHAVTPIAARYKGNTHVFAFDVMNEIDGVVDGTAATWAQARTYVSAAVSAIHSADPARLATCSVGYVPAWVTLANLTGLGMDFYDFHDYEDTPTFPTAACLGLDKPIFIGECGQSASDTTYTDTVQNSCMLSFLNTAYSGGYAGVEIWAYQYPGCPYDLLPMVNPDASWRQVCYTIQSWSPPGVAPVISSIPANGTVGTAIIITGQGFTGATAVSFNGATAIFTVNSATQITAIVPSAATSGTISVTTPNGTAQSGTSFFVLASPANLPAFTTLNSFKSGGEIGGGPFAGLILSGDILYGTAQYGGANGSGTVFAVKTDGTAAVSLHSFNNASDGMGPRSALILSGDILYGTSQNGTGPLGPDDLAEGKLFAVNTSGAGYTNLLTFLLNTTDAGGPSGVILSGNTLYGAAQYGGTGGSGTVFAVSTNGTGFTNLYVFTNGADGASPNAGVILAGNTLYGTASGGGSDGNGTVFKVRADGTGFTTLHSFSATVGSYPNPLTNSDGANPYAGLILWDGTLYGTTSAGGNSGSGTVFAVTTNGMNFTNLHSFAALQTNLLGAYTNSDGAELYAGLIISGNRLYGTASAGGDSGNGTIFSVGIEDADFTTLHNFTAINNGTNTDGAAPDGTLIISGDTLYGTASQGGAVGEGTIFTLSLVSITPPVTVIRSGTDVVLTWPTNNPLFTLQSTTALSPAVWNAVSPGPIVVSGQNTVTNPISGTQMFYRLIQQ